MQVWLVVEVPKAKRAEQFIIVFTCHAGIFLQILTSASFCFAWARSPATGRHVSYRKFLCIHFHFSVFLSHLRSLSLLFSFFLCYFHSFLLSSHFIFFTYLISSHLSFCPFLSHTVTTMHRKPLRVFPFRFVQDRHQLQTSRK